MLALRNAEVDGFAVAHGAVSVWLADGLPAQCVFSNDANDLAEFDRLSQMPQGLTLNASCVGDDDQTSFVADGAGEKLVGKLALIP